MIAIANFILSNRVHQEHRVCFRALFILLFLFSSSTQALEPAFEGYYRFYLGTTHSGYWVSRIVIDDKLKQMTSSSYTYVKLPDKLTTESLVAKSDLNFEPISFKYTALVGTIPKLVDGTFKNKIGTFKIINGKSESKKTIKVPANGFLSTFLNYVILKNGLAIGKNYSFLALSEEDPEFRKGTALIKKEEPFKGINSYVVEFNYNNIDFSGFIGPKGETLGSLSPAQNAGFTLVATREEAVGQFPFNEVHIKALFGDIPAGKANPLGQKSSPNKKDKSN